MWNYLFLLVLRILLYAYSESVLFRAWNFRILTFLWQIDPFIIMKCPSFFLVFLLTIKPTLFDVNIVTPEFLFSPFHQLFLFITTTVIVQNNSIILKSPLTVDMFLFLLLLMFYLSEIIWYIVLASPFVSLWCIWYSPMLLWVSIVPSFLLLSNIPLY